MKETTFSDSSELKMYSLGIVVENKGSEIKVSPIEGMNVQKQGKIFNPGKESKLKGNHTSDAGGKSGSTEVTYSNYITAEWLGIGDPNRVSPPTVYPNETVMLYKYGNMDKYYWTTFKHEPDLRKGESATYGYSCITDGGWKSDTEPVPMSGENSIYVTIGTGGVMLMTPTKGQPAAYNIFIDFLSGKLIIKDDLDNIIKLDSKKGTLNITTKNQITLKSDKRVTLEAKDVVVKGDLYVSGEINSMGVVKAPGHVKGPSEPDNIDPPATDGKPKVPTTAEKQAIEDWQSGKDKNPSAATVAAVQMAAFYTVMNPAIKALADNPATANLPLPDNLVTTDALVDRGPPPPIQPATHTDDQVLNVLGSSSYWV